MCILNKKNSTILPVVTIKTVTGENKGIYGYKEIFKTKEDEYIQFKDIMDYINSNKLDCIGVCLNAETITGEIIKLYSLNEYIFSDKELLGVKEAIVYFEQTIPPRNSKIYRELSNIVRNRDGKCLICGGTMDLTCHHIEPFCNGGFSAYNTNNCVTLCKNCHDGYNRFSRLEDMNAYNWTKWLLTKCEYKGLCRNYNDYERLIGEKE